MPYNFAADSFHAKKLCSRLSSSEVRLFTKIGRLAFLRPPLGDLGATYNDHLMPMTHLPETRASNPALETRKCDMLSSIGF